MQYPPDYSMAPFNCVLSLSIAVVMIDPLGCWHTVIGRVGHLRLPSVALPSSLIQLPRPWWSIVASDAFPEVIAPTHAGTQFGSRVASTSAIKLVSSMQSLATTSPRLSDILLHRLHPLMMQHRQVCHCNLSKQGCFTLSSPVV